MSQRQLSSHHKSTAQADNSGTPSHTQHDRVHSPGRSGCAASVLPGSLTHPAALHPLWAPAAAAPGKKPPKQQAPQKPSLAGHLSQERVLHSRVLTSLTPTSCTPNSSGRRDTTAASRTVGWRGRRHCPPRAGHTRDSRLASTANCMDVRGRRKDCRSHEIRVQGWKPRESKRQRPAGQTLGPWGEDRRTTT